MSVLNFIFDCNDSEVVLCSEEKSTKNTLNIQTALRKQSIDAYAAVNSVAFGPKFSW
jgi:hypothetical protein